VGLAEGKERHQGLGAYPSTGDIAESPPEGDALTDHEKNRRGGGLFGLIRGGMNLFIFKAVPFLTDAVLQ
jgi:hypothetical protein